MPIPSVTKIIDIALAEDIGSGDLTTDNLIDPNLEGRGAIIAKEPLVLAGVAVARQVFARLDTQIRFISTSRDGDLLKGADTALQVAGNLGALLTAERTALNFLQHLSGIATLVREYVDLLGKRRARLVDTRKTTPGLRALEKYAARVGGAYNHRMGLYDGILVKDNHIAAHGSIQKAVTRLRQRISHLLKIEIEVSNMAQVREAIAAGVDVIMLDNMEIRQIKEAVAFINGRALVEASGSITKQNIVLIADSGVDVISVGALIHSARSVDLSMRISSAALEPT